VKNLTQGVSMEQNYGRTLTMKKLLIALALAAFASVFVGCSASSEEVRDKINEVMDGASDAINEPFVDSPEAAQEAIRNSMEGDEAGEATTTEEAPADEATASEPETVTDEAEPVE
jgi:predicted transcriptional regulator